MTNKISKGLFHPCYFASIGQYSKVICCDEVIFEIHDHFQKQTYRNRCYIYTHQGKQLLNVPVKHSSSNKQYTKDVCVDYSENWQQQHFRTLKTAYNGSPFFEFYEDDLMKIFSKKHKFLIDLTMASHHFVTECLSMEIPHTFSKFYEEKKVTGDYRELVNTKQEVKQEFKEYQQHFSSKHGFLPNLSVLDLIFMEGPHSYDYLFST